MATGRASISKCAVPSNGPGCIASKLYRKAHLMGLGTVADVSLAEARDAAAVARKLVKQGIDPIERRRAERADAAGRAGLNTFSEVADAYIAAHAASWRNAKHRQQWSNTLHTYARPVLGNLGVATVDTGAVMRVLEPIWREKPETASRLRGRIESVLDYATARGWRTGDNPARWRGHMDNLLPPRAKIARVEHHAALPWREIGTFMTDLAQQDGVAPLALRFAILTAARTGEVIGAQWSEFDMQAGVWTVPASA
jgi:integrase